MKLISKQRISSKYYKKYGPPQTPYHRVMASNHVTNDAKDELEAVHNRLNPFILKQAIERKLRGIFQYVKVTSNVRQRIWS